METLIQKNIDLLTNSRKSVLLASLNREGLAEISSTPFIKLNNTFYVFISELASHTQNIKHHPKISIMLIEDEQDTKNAFARKRLSYACTAKFIDAHDSSWHSIMEQFEERQGNTVSILKQLQDFHLVELKALSGSYIEGFGKAYRLSGTNLDQVDLQTN